MNDRLYSGILPFSLQMLETVILFGQVSKVKPIIGMIPIPCPYNSALLS